MDTVSVTNALNDVLSLHYFEKQGHQDKKKCHPVFAEPGFKEP